MGGCPFGLPMSTALRSAPEGLNLFAVTGALVGYQPLVKYWRTRRAPPAAMGVAMEVPRMKASWKLEQDDEAGLLCITPALTLEGYRMHVVLCVLATNFGARSLIQDSMYGNTTFGALSQPHDYAAGELASISQFLLCLFKWRGTTGESDLPLRPAW